jgi:hypothetical protein
VEDDGGKFIDLVHAARGNAGNACELLFRASLLARAGCLSNTNLSTDGSVQKWIKSSYCVSHRIKNSGRGRLETDCWGEVVGMKGMRKQTSEGE